MSDMTHYDLALTGTPHIHRIPIEILSKIFEMGVDDSDDPESRVDFPLQISAVNKHFRAVACSTPSLWTMINFCSPPPVRSDPAHNYSYSRDQLWLARSQGCPIDLVMSFRDPSWNFNETCHYFRREHMERILTIIAPHSHRIRRFTLVCDTFAPVHAALLFLSHHGERMKLLETLELYRCNEYASEYPKFCPMDLAAPIPLLGGSTATKLRRVCLAGVHVDWSRSLIPLRGLQDLELSYHSQDVRPSFSDFIEILRNSPELKSLGIIGSGPVPPLTTQEMDSGKTADPPRVPTSSSITTLKIGYYHAWEALLMLNLIDKSSVTSLTLQDLSRPSENDIEGGSAILFSLSKPDLLPVPKLQSLTLDTVKAMPQFFAACLYSCPQITTLALDSVSRSMPYVLASTDFSPPGSLLPCPALRDLSLRLVPDLAAGSIVRARNMAGLGVDTLSIYFADADDESEMALARENCNTVIIFGEEDNQSSWGETEDPYAPGGAFNDPDFDAMYSMDI